MHPYNLNPGSDSLRFLQIAENLLKTRDLIGTKHYALKARESDPNSVAAEQILAIVDTLIAGDKKISNSNLDWYAILQLGRRTHDSELIAVQYKRLGVLLNPNRNKYAHAEHAYKLVTEAYMVLSNPSRKFQFDNEFGNSNATHFNFTEMMQGRNQLIGGGNSGSFEGTGNQLQRNQLIGGSYEGTEMQQGENQVFGGSSGSFKGTEMQQGQIQLIGGSSGSFKGAEMQQGQNQLIGGTEMQHGQNQLIGGSSGSYEGTEMQQGRNQNQHFDFMQDGSGNQMQFAQHHQQQPVFEQQAISFFGEEQGQENGLNLTRQLNWSDKGKQPMVRAEQELLVRPQPQQPLLRPHMLQTWFQQPEVQTHMQHSLPQSQPYILQPQPSHWSQQPQSPLNQPQPQPQSWMQQALPRPRVQQSRESLEQPQRPLGLSQQVPREQPQQTLHSPQHVPWPLHKSGEPPQHSLHSSQPVPQVLPLLQPQARMQESLPGPQIQTSSLEPQLQPEKTPPESREGINNGMNFNFGEIGDNADIHDNNVNVEKLADFWTMCPYCFYMHEYPGIYLDCALRCQRCKKAFHATNVDAPPDVAEGEDAYFNCWGYFPIGISPSYLEKRKAEASNWQPVSKLFAVPRGGYTSAFPQGGTEFSFPQGGTEFAYPQGGSTSKAKKPRDPRNSGPKICIDDLDHIFGDILSDSDDDNDWRYAPKYKKARRNTRRVSTAEKVKEPQALAEMVQDSNTGNLQSEVMAQDGSGVNVPQAAMNDADKKKVPVRLRKQPGRAAKNLGKLDVVVAQQASGASVPDVAEGSLSLTNQPKDNGKPDAVDGSVAEDGLNVSMSVLKRKRPGSVEKDLEKLDGVDSVVGGLDVSIPDVEAVSVPARKQPSRVAKDSGKLDGVVAEEGKVVGVPDVAAPIVSVAEANKKVMGEAEKKSPGGSSKKRASVPTRKQPGRVAKDLGKLDLNVEFNNDVEGPARGTTGGSKEENGGEENVDGTALFDGLDEYLDTLPVLAADAGDKVKSVSK